MQRVRIGLTGLAFVFILVLLSAIFLTPREEAPITAESIEQHRTPDPVLSAEARDAPGSDAAPKEPLAELGVTPGNVAEQDDDAEAAVPIEPAVEEGADAGR